MAASGDIVDRIKHDHEELEEAYSKYKAAHRNGDENEAGKWFREFVWEISRHSVSEEIVLYPMLDGLGERGKDLATQSRQEHQHVKEMLEKLLGIDNDPALFERTMDDMMHDLREHIKKEEKDDLPLVTSHVSDQDRESAGKKFELGKKLAPTRPHAGVPNDKAALEAAMGLLLKPIDKLRDVFSSFPSGT